MQPAHPPPGKKLTRSQVAAGVGPKANLGSKFEAAAAAATTKKLLVSSTMPPCDCALVPL